MDEKVNDSVEEAYQLFKNQKNLFVEELKEKFKVHFSLNWANVNIGKRGNWFICWVPLGWGIPKKGFGVHYDFMHYRDKKGIDYVRLPVGVENPLKHEFREDFKKDVAYQFKQQNLKSQDYRIWPDVGFRGVKLLEPKPIVLNGDTYKKVIELYSSLSTFNTIVGEVSKRYYSRDCFSSPLTF